MLAGAEFFTTQVPLAALPAIYRSQAGFLNGIPNTSISGPVQLCIETSSLTKSPAGTGGFPFWHMALTATLQVKFAGVDFPKVNFSSAFFTHVNDPRAEADLLVAVLSGDGLSAGCTSCVLPTQARDNLLRDLVNILSTNVAAAKDAVIPKLWSAILADGRRGMFYRDIQLSCMAANSNRCPDFPVKGYWGDDYFNKSPRGRFLHTIGTYYRDPANVTFQLLQLEAKTLGMAASMLRLQSSLSIPDFVRSVDPLRILLAGSPKGRLLDTALFQDIFTCVSKMDDAANNCNFDIINLIEDGVIENRLLEFGQRVQSTHTIINALPWTETATSKRLNTGNVYDETLKARFNALLSNSSNSENSSKDNSSPAR